MGKFPEAAARLFKDKFVCRECKSVIKTTNLKISSGSIKCRNCTSKHLRPKRKK